MDHKIIFAGPEHVGKTSAIRSVSSALVLGGDSKHSGNMDYGILHLPDEDRLHLYGTPGEKKFDLMWGILSSNAMGFVILLDCERPDPIADLELYLNSFRKSILASGNAVVIGLTRAKIAQQPLLTAMFYRKLAEMGLNIPVFEVDCRKREDVKQMLMALAALLDQQTVH